MKPHWVETAMPRRDPIQGDASYMTSHGMARLTYAAEYEGSRVLVNTMNGRSIADAHHYGARSAMTS